MKYYLLQVSLTLLIYFASMHFSHSIKVSVISALVYFSLSTIALLSPVLAETLQDAWSTYEKPWKRRSRR